MQIKLIAACLDTCNEVALHLIRYRNPDMVLLAVPRHLRAWENEFRTRLPSRISCKSVPVSQYDIEHNRTRLLRAFKSSYDPCEVEICLNTGPCGVRIAAMQCARARGYRASLVDTDAMRIRDLFHNYPAEVMEASVKSYLLARNVEMGTSYSFQDSHAEMAEYLIEHLQGWSELVARFRGKGFFLEQDHTFARHSLQQTHLEILHALDRHHMLQISDTDDWVTYRFVHDSQIAFINGKWLEIFVHNRLASLFDDCKCGQLLTTPTGIREVDFIGLQAGRFVLASCKTARDPYHLTYLRELQTLSEQIREPTCARFYITDRFRSVQDEDDTEFETYARQHAIEVIFGDNLNNISEIIRRSLP